MYTKLHQKPPLYISQVIINVLWILNHSNKFCFKIYEPMKKIFLPETHICVKELIISEGVHFLVLFFIFIIVAIIIIGLIKYM